MPGPPLGWPNLLFSSSKPFLSLIPRVKRPTAAIAEIVLFGNVSFFAFLRSPNMSSGAKKKSHSSRNETKSRGEPNNKWSEWSKWEWSAQKGCYMRTRTNSNGLLLLSTITGSILRMVQCRRYKLSIRSQPGSVFSCSIKHTAAHTPIPRSVSCRRDGHIAACQIRHRLPRFGGLWLCASFWTEGHKSRVESNGNFGTSTTNVRPSSG